MASIEWIDVTVRVPDNRRQVLTWGNVYVSFKSNKWTTGFLGATRFNPSFDGGDWDIERDRRLSLFTKRVTHWAEIEGPAEPRKPPAPPPPPPLPPSHKHRKGDSV